jgi:rRNA biogenesis protein RRP5
MSKRPASVLSEFDDEPSFVRGKQNKTTHAPVASTPKPPAVEQDVLFGNKAPKSESKSKSASSNKNRVASDKNKQPNHKSNKKGADNEEDDMSVQKDRKPVNSNALTYKQLTVGTLFLGAVKSVNDLDLVISLPDGLSGYVSLRDISDVMAERVDTYIANNEEIENDESNEDIQSKQDKKSDDLPELKSMFTVGQFVRCVIIKLEIQEANQKKRIDLSMRPSLLNANLTSAEFPVGSLAFGCVKSVEDKGYVVELGLQDATKCFLPFKNISNPNKKYVPGEPIEGVVHENSGSGAAIKLSIPDRESLAQIYIKSSSSASKPLQISQLKPGTMVKCKVDKKFSSGGLCLNFLDFFYGTVTPGHLNAAVSTASSEDLDKLKVKARIVYFNPTTKAIKLSLKQHIVSLSSFYFPSFLQRGGILESVTAIKVDDTGVHVTIPFPESYVDPSLNQNEDKDENNEEAAQAQVRSVLGFTHVSNLSDAQVQNVAKQFPLSSTHKARIMSFNTFDGVVNLTFQTSVINQPYLSYEDIRVGDMVQGEIMMSNESFGLKIKLSENIKGICPLLHMADMPLKTLKAARYLPGKQMKFRVLKVDAKAKKLVLTHKQSMVKSDLPLITSYEQAVRLLYPFGGKKKREENDISDSSAFQAVFAYGFVTSARDFGVIVEFFDGVHGLCSIKELRKSGVLLENQQPQDIYVLGQLIKCRILYCDPKAQKMALSFNMSAETRKNDGASKEK